MSVAMFGRAGDYELPDLERRIVGAQPPAPPGGGGRPASLMDALHDRITHVVEVTRSELRSQAAVVEGLVEQVDRLEAAVAALTGALAASPAAGSAELFRRMEARLDANARAVEEGFRSLMVWLDAPAGVVVDLSGHDAAPSEADRS